MTTDDEAVTGRLLRVAGLRPAVPDERAERVRLAVRTEWQAGTRRRAHARRRRIAVSALLTAAAGAALLVGLRPLSEMPVAPDVPLLATVEQVAGDVRRLPPGGQAPESPRLSPGQPLGRGDWILTGPTSRVAVRIGTVSLRFDTDSRARLTGASALELARGAVYVDTGGESTGIEVRTSFGTARDVGTQFEVRLGDSSMRVRVRTGLVDVMRDDRVERARPGMEVTFAGGDVVRASIDPYGPEWEWASRLAPPFDIEGRSVAAFLEHVSRERGWTLRYADGELARDASGMLLRGSVAGLDPDQALSVALAATGLSHALKGGELLVSRAP